MEQNLFRKNALERMTSPDQLNDYLKVTSVSIWCVLFAIGSLMLGVVAWGFWGSIPESVQLTGVAFSKTATVDTVYCYVPVGTSKRLTLGMKAQVSPDYAPRGDHGYIYGNISAIGNTPVTTAQLTQTFGSLNYLQEVLPSGNVIEVKITLATKGEHLKWSKASSETISLTGGSKCHVLVVTEERKPYELLISKK